MIGEIQHFPEGSVVRKLNGSPTVLKELLANLKKYSFTGYIKVLSKKNSIESEGYILLKEGLMIFAYLSKRSNSTFEEFFQKDAIKTIYTNARHENSIIELHTQVNVDDIRKTLKEKQKKVGALVEFEKPLTPEEPVIEKKEVPPVKIEKEVDKLSVSLTELEDLAIEPKPEPQPQPEIDTNILDTLLQEKKPVIPESTVESPDVKVREKEIYDMILKPEPSAVEPGKNIFCLYCGRRLTEEVCSTCITEGITFNEIEDESKSISNFTVSQSNLFAYSIIYAISRYPGTLFNPVTLTGSKYTGKTHLLKGLWLEIKLKSDINIVYINCRKLQDFFKLATPNRIKILEEIKTREFILLDDIENITDAGLLDYITGFIQTFKKNNRQIVISAGTTEELLKNSNIELYEQLKSGLFVNITEPDSNLKKIIIRNLLRHDNIAINNEFIEFGVDTRLDVETIHTGLKKALSLSRITQRELTLQDVQEAFKDFMVMKESEKKTTPQISIQPGLSYLIEEDKPSKIFELFETKVKEGFNGLCITRINPKRVYERYDIGRTEVLWLTDKERGTHKVVPPSLEQVHHEIESSFGIPDKVCIVLDGIDYLIAMNSFDNTITFLRMLIDEISDKDTILLISLPRNVLKENEIRVLKRELETISY